MLSTRRTRTPPGNPDSFSSKYGAGKVVSRSRKQQLLRDSPSVSRRLDRRQASSSPPHGRSLSPAVITLCVGPQKRLFAAHKDILCVSPFFAAAYTQAQPSDSPNRRVNLPDEQPEVFSCILEYLYKGDYYPQLVHNKQLNSWELEDTGTDKDGQSNGATLFHHAAGAEILRDTAVYCAADKYGLDLLKRLALRKQGLHSGIQCSTILTSARYAYSNTPENESKLRAHYLALIIRSRSTFKRSGTMQMEMEQGGKLFFDLFVAMCNHMIYQMGRLTEYQVIGRHLPTEANPTPKLYRMRIFAPNTVVAKSRFWYFLTQLRKVKKANGEIVSLNVIPEKRHLKVKNFGIWIRYDSRSGTHNMYKEFREMSRTEAVEALYQDMAARHRARFGSIHILKVVEVEKADSIRRPYIKQLLQKDLKFPLPHRAANTENKKIFAYSRPATFA